MRSQATRFHTVGRRSLLFIDGAGALCRLVPPKTLTHDIKFALACQAAGECGVSYSSSREVAMRQTLLKGMMALLLFACSSNCNVSAAPQRRAQSTRSTASARPRPPETPKSDQKPSDWPSFSTVTEVVEQSFKAKRHYKPGDLISRGDLDPIFAELGEMGWKVNDRTEIERQLLPDNDFLVRELSTSDGRTFMRQVARYPEGYDRLDRLVDLSDGKVILRRLINGPDGYKLLEYMTTAPGGREMGKMLAGAPHGRNFNQPTSRIYTAEQLLDRLRSSHEADGKKQKAEDGRQ
jgi:hypothetical protein